MNAPNKPQPQLDVMEAEMRNLDIDLDRVWHRIEGDVWAAQTSWLEHRAAILLGSPALARALVTTPSLLLSWLLASLGVFGVGVLVSMLTGTPVVALLAPAVAAIAVAFAYGAGADPAYEITRTLPVPARMILLVRVLVVFTTNALIGLIAMQIAPEVAGVTLLWLLPMVAISVLGLAVATLSHSATLGGVAAIAVWSAIVLASHWRTASFDAAVLSESQSMLLPVYMIMTGVCFGITLWLSGDSAQRREFAGWS
jgi:hypothetical protein